MRMTLSRLRARRFGAQALLVVLACAAPAAAQAPAAVQAHRPVPTSSSSSPTMWATATSAATARPTSRRRTSTASRRERHAAHRLLRRAELLADARRADQRPLSAALRASRIRLAPRDTARRARAAGDRPLAAAAAEEQRLRTGLIGKWHLGYKPEFSPNAHGFDYFFGFKSGLIDYYQHTDSDRAARPVRERRAGARHRLHDRSDHRAVGEVHRRERQAAVLPRGRLQRRALAVPGARSSVGGGGQRAIRPAAGRSDQHAADYVAILERADQGVGKILATLERLRADAQHAGDLHAGQRRRVAVAQRAAVPSQGHGLGGRHPRAGDLPLAWTDSRRARRPRRSASSWTSRRRSSP